MSEVSFITRLKHNLLQLTESISQVTNVVVCTLTNTDAWCDETLGAHAWRCADNKYWGYYLKYADKVFFFDKKDAYGHCELCYTRLVDKCYTPIENRRISEK